MVVVSSIIFHVSPLRGSYRSDALPTPRWLVSKNFWYFHSENWEDD